MRIVPFLFCSIGHYLAKFWPSTGLAGATRPGKLRVTNAILSLRPQLANSSSKWDIRHNALMR